MLVTLYSFDKAAISPSNCSSKGTTANYTNNFIDLPYNGILCDMMKVMKSPANVRVVQAARRISQSNYQIVMVYTHHRGAPHERGDRIMIDYTMFQVFNVEGVLPDKKERLVAYESKRLQLDDPTDGPIAVDLSGDKIGRLLKELDPSYIDQQSIDYFVRMASMRVRWENGDYSDFALTKALVINAVETPTWWIVTVVLLFIAFLVPQASRLIVRRIPEYSKDLRTLLLLTLRYSSECGGTSKAKTVGISVNELNSTADRMALLTVDGCPVAVGEKIDGSEEARLIDEGVVHPKGSKLDRCG